MFRTLLGTAFLVLASALLVSAAQKPARDDSAAEKLGWRLGVQAWTFRDRTAFEAIDTAARLGLKYIELYPGQSFSPEHKDLKVDTDLTDEQRVELLKKLASAHVKAVSFGVVGFSKDEQEARKLFDFAKALGLENISCEPEEGACALVDKLCNEYGIRAAIHDHPKPSHYWDPQIVLDAVKDCSPKIGSCADTGHWKRSGLVPVECLKKLEGRVIESHFKDIADGVDQPWGTGQCDARGLLAEFKRQGFRGLIDIEYEDGAGEVLEQNVAKCIEFFDKTARELSK
ncbi:MAG: sugar phosphate isomerase/epimerase [Planctomycetes bacterium]|nr:sugar phosphate isomerase/epimerase [Planctomycetota bacterium]